MTVTRALVLGGGGLAGISWETGVLAGLAASGVDVTAPDLIVGTSAGAILGAQLSGGVPVEELYARLLKEPRPGDTLEPAASIGEMRTMFADLAKVAQSGNDWRRRVGAAALAAETVPESVRREVMAARLPSHEWPSMDLAIVAVDARTGEPRVFRRDADLVDAIAASCALPTLWPPVTIGDARYVDGGIRSVANADLAEGYDRVIILAPMTDRSLQRQSTALQESAQVHVFKLDQALLSGTDIRDPATREPAAKAGHAQGIAAASEIEALWQ